MRLRPSLFCLPGTNRALTFYDRFICHSGRTRWLYVSDLQNNLYVGIKKTGSFQHSSFLYGARVTSAGAPAPSHFTVGRRGSTLVLMIACSRAQA